MIGKSDQSPEGRDAQRLDAKHASGGPAKQDAPEHLLSPSVPPTIGERQAIRAAALELDSWLNRPLGEIDDAPVDAMRTLSDAILSLTKNVATNADMRGGLELAARRFESLADIERAGIQAKRPCASHAALVCFVDWAKEARTVLQGDQS